MKKLLFVIITSAIFYGTSAGQSPDTLTITDCFSAALKQSPLSRRAGIEGEVIAQKIKNLNNNWFPVAGIQAQASYNSETIDFSDVLGNMPGIPSLPHDQYKIWADITQQIYDGGVIKAQKEIESAGYHAEVQQIQSELLTLKQQVSQVYFSLLLAEKNQEILDVSVKEIDTRKLAIESGVKHGMILEDNLLALEAEKMTMEQNLAEVNELRKQLISMLSLLLDTTFSANLVVAEPSNPVADETGVRPEFLLFNSQSERLTATKKLVVAGDMPKLFAYSQLAYGRPGYNMLSEDFHTFYTIGAGFRWNFLNYGDTRRQKRIIELQKDLVEVRKENFNTQLQLQMIAESSNISKYDSLMKKDEEILRLRKAIAEASLSKLNNGVITSAGYISDMNAEIMAKLRYQNHKIMKMQAAYNFLLLQGKM